MPHWALVVACSWETLELQRVQCCSSPHGTSWRHEQVSPLLRYRVIAGYENCQKPVTRHRYIAISQKWLKIDGYMPRGVWQGPSFDPCKIYRDDLRGVGYPADARSVGDSHPSCLNHWHVYFHLMYRMKIYWARAVMGNATIFPRELGGVLLMVNLNYLHYYGEMMVLQ